MTGSDQGGGRGDDLDDPVMRSMRAVWVSMRDEEPPAGGLSELLAAARTKAEELRPKEPWWRRALEALRRPPVLALATVVVLIGGAVVISGRRETFDAMPRVESAAPAGSAMAEPAHAAEGRGAAQAPAAASAPAGMQAASIEAPAPTEASAGEALGREAAETQGVARPTSAVRRPGNAAPAQPRPRAGGRPQVAVDDQKSGRLGELEREEGGVAAGGAPGAAGAPDGDVQAAPLPVVVTPPPPPSPPSETAAESRRQTRPGTAGTSGKKDALQIADDAGSEITVSGPRTAPVSSSSSGAGGARGPSVEQLAKQSETAAARSDCAAVRAVVARMGQLDAAFQKRHVEGNAAVKRCMKS